MIEHPGYYDDPEADAERAEEERDLDDYLWQKADADYDAEQETDQ